MTEANQTLNKGPFMPYTEVGRTKLKLMRQNRPVTTAEQQSEIETLAAMPDEMIDTSDIPETSNWSGAVRGLFSMSAEEQKEALANLRSRRAASKADEIMAAASD